MNSLIASGGTTFSTALSRTYSLIQSNNYDKEETFVIFVSDGVGGSPGVYASQVRSLVNTVYSIGIGSGASTTYLTEIASPDCYFNASEGLDSLSDIFTRIQEEIREEVTVKSENGLVPLPDLFVTVDYPFTLTIGENLYEFPTISSISDILTINSAGVYCLDLVKLDNKYKLNGDFSGVKFLYYYDEG